MPTESPTVPSTTVDDAHAQQVILFAAATMAELRDSDTESHLIRVQHYVRTLAQSLQSHPTFAAVLTPAYIDTLCACVPVYDLGTMSVPDRILLKPGRLTSEELSIMRTHTTHGHAALVRAEASLGRSTPLLTVAKQLTLSHHEKWDGTGYPQGLADTQIPLAARIMAVADVYDALISHKVYKDGIAHAQAVQVIVGERGKHFDPDLVDAFAKVADEFAAIAARFADTDADMQQKIEYLANAIAETAEL